MAWVRKVINIMEVGIPSNTRGKLAMGSMDSRGEDKDKDRETGVSLEIPADRSQGRGADLALTGRICLFFTFPMI